MSKQYKLVDSKRYAGLIKLLQENGYAPIKLKKYKDGKRPYDSSKIGDLLIKQPWPIYKATKSDRFDKIVHKWGKDHNLFTSTSLVSVPPRGKAIL